MERSDTDFSNMSCETTQMALFILSLTRNHPLRASISAFFLLVNRLLFCLKRKALKSHTTPVGGLTLITVNPLSFVNLFLK
jgi:hypothetical protein